MTKFRFFFPLSTTTYSGTAKTLDTHMLARARMTHSRPEDGSLIRAHHDGLRAVAAVLCVRVADRRPTHTAAIFMVHKMAMPRRISRVIHRPPS